MSIFTLLLAPSLALIVPVQKREYSEEHLEVINRALPTLQQPLVITKAPAWGCESEEWIKTYVRECPKVDFEVKRRQMRGHHLNAFANKQSGLDDQGAYNIHNFLKMMFRHEFEFPVLTNEVHFSEHCNHTDVLDGIGDTKLEFKRLLLSDKYTYPAIFFGTKNMVTKASVEKEYSNTWLRVCHGKIKYRIITHTTILKHWDDLSEFFAYAGKTEFDSFGLHSIKFMDLFDAFLPTEKTVRDEQESNLIDDRFPGTPIYEVELGPGDLLVLPQQSIWAKEVTEDAIGLVGKYIDVTPGVPARRSLELWGPTCALGDAGQMHLGDITGGSCSDTVAKLIDAAFQGVDMGNKSRATLSLKGIRPAASQLTLS